MDYASVSRVYESDSDQESDILLEACTGSEPAFLPLLDRFTSSVKVGANSSTCTWENVSHYD